MKTITITDIAGKQIIGNWNEKTYNSNKSDYRVYLDNQEYHVTKEALEAASAGATKKAEEVAEKARLYKLAETFEEIMRENNTKGTLVDMRLSVKEFLKKNDSLKSFEVYEKLFLALENILYDNFQMFELALKYVKMANKN